MLSHQLPNQNLHGLPQKLSSNVDKYLEDMVTHILVN
jgi:hypothetical protein